MTKQIFSVYDSKGEIFSQPFMTNTKGEAIRSFTDFVNEVGQSNVGNDVARHPEDFTLFHLGEFDDNSGKYTCPATPISIGLAVEFKKVSPDLKVVK